MSTAIYIIRHGDKPTDKDAKPYGVKISGEQDFRSLLVKGWQRAGCWVGYFLPSGAPFAGVTAENLHVFASARDKHDEDSDPTDSTGTVDGSKSRRPVETVTPLAAMLNPSTTPDDAYTKGQEAKVAAAAVAQKRPNVVICWQHEGIPAIVNAVTGSTTIPGGVTWGSDCFNGIAVLTSPDGGTSWQFSQAAPVLLDGDTSVLPFGELRPASARG